MSRQTVLYSLSTAHFFNDYFESNPLLIARSKPDYFCSLLTIDEIDRLLTTLDFQYPRIILVNAEREIDVAEYTADGNTIDVGELYRLHAAGATIILNQLHTRHPALAQLCAALEFELSAPVQTNVYVTPSHAQGFKVHFDTHDVLVLQLHGSKRWRLYGTPIPLPLQEQQGAETDPGTPTREIDLNAGDTLYIPRGVLHDATSCDDTSVHATVGLLAYLWSDVLSEALDAVILKDPRFRRALPREFIRPDFDYKAAREHFGELLRQFLETADFEAAIEVFINQFIDRRTGRLRGQMAQLKLLESLTVNNMIACRPALAHRLREDDHAIRIQCYGREISVPAFAAAGAVRCAMKTPCFRVRDLPGSALDDESKLVLVRRLGA